MSADKINRKSRLFSFQHFLIGFRIFYFIGLCPFSIQSYENKHDQKSFKFVDSSSGFMITLLISMINTIYQSSLMCLSYNLTIVTTVSFFAFSALLLINLFSVVLISVRIISLKENFSKALNKLLKVHSEIEQIGPYFKRSSSCSYMIIYIASFISIASFNLYFTIPKAPERTLLDKLFLTQFWVAFIWEVCYLTQYAILVKQIYYEFQDLNDILEQTSLLSLDGWLKLKENQRLHVDLCEISQKISHFYSVPVIGCLASFLIANSFNIYSVCRQITMGQEGSMLLVLQNCMFFIAQMTPVVFLTRSVTETLDEVFIYN